MAKIANKKSKIENESLFTKPSHSFAESFFTFRSRLEGS
jgi:hypothetical protein